MDKQLTDLLFELSRLKWKRATFESETSHLSILQMHALGFLLAKKSASMREIAERFKIEMPSATSLINKLFSRALVERQPDSQDRRVVRIVLTSKGEKLLRGSIEKHNQKIAHVLSYLTENDKKDFFRILQTIVEKMDEDYEK